MIIRDKHVGKSTYRIIKVVGGFSIMEIHRGREATAPARYPTMDDAIRALDAFDKEKIIIGD